MAYIMPERIKRKLHYQALVIGILKAIKEFIKDHQVNEVLDECIDIADKLGDGYKLVKVDKLIELVEQMRDADFDYMNHTSSYTEGNRDTCNIVLRLLEEACYVCDTEYKDR